MCVYWLKKVFPNSFFLFLSLSSDFSKLSDITVKKGFVFPLFCCCCWRINDKRFNAKCRKKRSEWFAKKNVFPSQSLNKRMKQNVLLPTVPCIKDGEMWITSRFESKKRRTTKKKMQIMWWRQEKLKRKPDNFIAVFFVFERLLECDTKCN